MKVFISLKLKWSLWGMMYIYIFNFFKIEMKPVGNDCFLKCEMGHWYSEQSIVTELISAYRLKRFKMEKNRKRSLLFFYFFCLSWKIRLLSDRESRCSKIQSNCAKKKKSKQNSFHFPLFWKFLQWYWIEKCEIFL